MYGPCYPLKEVVDRRGLLPTTSSSTEDGMKRAVRRVCVADALVEVETSTTQNELVSAAVNALALIVSSSKDFIGPMLTPLIGSLFESDASGEMLPENVAMAKSFAVAAGIILATYGGTKVVEFLGLTMTRGFMTRREIRECSSLSLDEYNAIQSATKGEQLFVSGVKGPKSDKKMAARDRLFAEMKEKYSGMPTQDALVAQVRETGKRIDIVPLRRLIQLVSHVAVTLVIPEARTGIGRTKQSAAPPIATLFPEMMSRLGKDLSKDFTYYSNVKYDDFTDSVQTEIVDMLLSIDRFATEISGDLNAYMSYSQMYEAMNVLLDGMLLFHQYRTYPKNEDRTDLKLAARLSKWHDTQKAFLAKLFATHKRGFVSDDWMLNGFSASVSATSTLVTGCLALSAFLMGVTAPVAVATMTKTTTGARIATRLVESDFVSRVMARASQLWNTATLFRSTTIWTGQMVSNLIFSVATSSSASKTKTKPRRWLAITALSAALMLLAQVKEIHPPVSAEIPVAIERETFANARRLMGTKCSLVDTQVKLITQSDSVPSLKTMCESSVSGKQEDSIRYSLTLMSIASGKRSGFDTTLNYTDMLFKRSDSSVLSALVLADLMKAHGGSAMTTVEQHRFCKAFGFGMSSAGIVEYSDADYMRTMYAAFDEHPEAQWTQFFSMFPDAFERLFQAIFDAIKATGEDSATHFETFKKIFAQVLSEFVSEFTNIEGVLRSMSPLFNWGHVSDELTVRVANRVVERLNESIKGLKLTETFASAQRAVFYDDVKRIAEWRFPTNQGTTSEFWEDGVIIRRCVETESCSKSVGRVFRDYLESNGIRSTSVEAKTLYNAVMEKKFPDKFNNGYEITITSLAWWEQTIAGDEDLKKVMKKVPTWGKGDDRLVGRPLSPDTADVDIEVSLENRMYVEEVTGISNVVWIMAILQIAWNLFKGKTGGARLTARVPVGREFATGFGSCDTAINGMQCINATMTEHIVNATNLFFHGTSFMGLSPELIAVGRSRGDNSIARRYAIAASQGVSVESAWSYAINTTQMEPVKTEATNMFTTTEFTDGIKITQNQCIERYGSNIENIQTTYKRWTPGVLQSLLLTKLPVSITTPESMTIITFLETLRTKASELTSHQLMLMQVLSNTLRRDLCMANRLGMEGLNWTTTTVGDMTTVITSMPQLIVGNEVCVSKTGYMFVNDGIGVATMSGCSLPVIDNGHDAYRLPSAKPDKVTMLLPRRSGVPHEFTLNGYSFSISHTVNAVLVGIAGETAVYASSELTLLAGKKLVITRDGEPTSITLETDLKAGTTFIIPTDNVATTTVKFGDWKLRTFPNGDSLVVTSVLSTDGKLQETQFPMHQNGTIANDVSRMNLYIGTTMTSEYKRKLSKQAHPGWVGSLPSLFASNPITADQKGAIEKGLGSGVKYAVMRPNYDMRTFSSSWGMLSYLMGYGTSENDETIQNAYNGLSSEQKAALNEILAYVTSTSKSLGHVFLDKTIPTELTEFKSIVDVMRLEGFTPSQLGQAVMRSDPGATPTVDNAMGVAANRSMLWMNDTEIALSLEKTRRITGAMLPMRTKEDFDGAFKQFTWMGTTATFEYVDKMVIDKGDVDTFLKATAEPAEVKRAFREFLETGKLDHESMKRTWWEYGSSWIPNLMGNKLPDTPKMTMLTKWFNTFVNNFSGLAGDGTGVEWGSLGQLRLSMSYQSIYRAESVNFATLDGFRTSTGYDTVKKSEGPIAE